MHASRIGPNAITRVAEALREEFGAGGADRVFALAGLDRYLRHPPESMVDEQEVALLHRRLRESMGTTSARRIGREAGRRTGDYLLAHRIPKPVQWLLRRLPAAVAARVLLGAISKHAWTFAGSGEFRVLSYSPLVLSLRGNPLCRDTTSAEPVCDFYAATFERLFRELVHRDSVVTEIACESTGAAACLFRVDWCAIPQLPSAS
jgi:divinyl protochlorophyllide a 8-vinyl-reductase